MKRAVNIVTVSPEQMDRAVAVLTAGFVADPLFRWVYRDAWSYLASFPTFVGLLASPGCAEGTFYADGEFGAVAAWLSPGTMPDEDALEKHIEQTVRTEIRDDLFGVFEQMDAYQHRASPCWYLPMIAADANRQGRGLGSALLAHALERVDREGTQAYLETAKPANVPLYERHGFEVVGRIDVGSAPTVLPMVRPAR